MTLTRMPLLGPGRAGGPPDLDAGRVRVLLCDGETTLFPCTGTSAPDPDVLGALSVLGQRFTMALTTEDPEAAARSLEACALAASFPEQSRFALPPTPEEGLTVTADPAQVIAARDRGLPVVGNLQYVAPADRPDRSRELLDAGATTVVTSWEHLLVALLG